MTTKDTRQQLTLPSPRRSCGPEPTFADFDVHPDIVAALAEAGIVHRSRSSR